MKNFRLGLNGLKNINNKYFKSILFDRTIKNRKYDKGKIAIGKTKRGTIYYLDTSEVMRVLMVGTTRTGKTFSVRGITDRAIQGGFNVLFATDIKNEFYSSNQVVQEKFRKNLLKNEKPTRTNVMVFRPTFFKTVRGYQKLPKDNYWYTPDITDLNELDFMTLMKVNTLTDPQKIAMKEIYEKVSKFEGNLKIDDIYTFIEELKDYDDRQKKSLRTKFLPLKYSGILDDSLKKGLPFEELYNAKIPISLNMQGFDALGRDGAGLPQVYVSIFLRKTITLRRDRKIKPVFIVVDEASRFVPRDSEPSTKIEIMESVDIDSREGIFYFFLVQTPWKLPEEIINQCKYFFIPYNADIKSFKYLFKLSGIVTWASNQYQQKCARLKQQMNKFEWVVIDRNKNDYEIIKMLSPLSYHAESDT